MRKNLLPGFSWLIALVSAFGLASCNNNSEQIPFPEKEFGFSQPLTVPLKFGDQKKLTWDTARLGGLKSVTKKLDLNALTALPFDTSGFRTFPKLPQIQQFDFAALKDTVFDIDQMPSRPLNLKTALMAPPTMVKASIPMIQKGNPLAIADFGTKQGLPAIFITSLLKDHNGLLWIASREGLFRYDGESVQTIATGDMGFAGMVEDNEGKIWYISAMEFGVIDPANGTISWAPFINTLVNNLCKIIKDDQGSIWISKTRSQEVYIVDPVLKTYKTLSHSNGLPPNGACYVSKDKIGNVWISTYTGGALIINRAEKKLRHLGLKNGLANDSLRAVVCDSNGTAWLGVAGGVLDAVDISKGTITHFGPDQGLVKAYTHNISVDDKGMIWMGKNAGIDIVDPNFGRSRFISEPQGLVNSLVSSCTMDNVKRMWVSTIGGLHVIDQNAETVNPLGTAQVASLTEDVIGNTWVATLEGIRIIDAQKKFIRRLDKTNGLADDYIQAFSQFNNQMWVSTDGGLEIIDPIQKTIQHIGKKEGLVSDTVYVVFKDHLHNTWLTGPSNGIDLADSARQLILHTDIKGGLSDDNIGDVKEDKDGFIWLGGFARGVSVVDLKTGTVRYLNNQPGLRDSCNKNLLVDSMGRIWIGTDKGIYVVDKKQNSLTTISSKEGLPSNHITSLLEYRGSVVVGGMTQLSLITPPSSSDKQWKVAIVEKSEKLAREQTNAWATDAITKDGRYLWGDNGFTVIYGIKPITDSTLPNVTGMTLMNKQQHFLNNESLKDKDSLWVGDTFYVKGEVPKNTGYTTAKQVEWNHVAGAYNLPENLTIPYNKNYLQFQFAEPHLGRQNVVLYSYLLQGIDKNWSEPGPGTFTENYLNLPPGEYTFKVSSKMASAKWSTPATFGFTITPPWYKTWWAYTIWLLILLGLIRLYVVYRSRRLLGENRLLEEKVTLRTKQLQESLEDLKATQVQLVQSEKMASLGELTAGIAHEIQNPLNFVNNFSEVSNELLDEMKAELLNNNTRDALTLADDVKNNLEKIIHHGKRADSIVKGMLQHSRSSNAVKEPTDINALAEEYLRLSYHGLRAKDTGFNVTMKTEFDPTIGKVNVIPQDLGRVLLNLYNNAFYAVMEKKRHLQNGYEPMLFIKTQKAKGGTEIMIRDNGNGIPKKVLDKIFQPFFTTKPTGQGTGLGLSLSYDIIKIHGGDLKVETREGEGSTFIIGLPA